MKSADIELYSRPRKFAFWAMALKLFLATALLLSTVCLVQAQDLKTIKLSSPDKEGGLPIMKALSLRQSTKDADKWSEKDLSLQDLSNLLWAANGVNRDDGKRTAPSAQNAQDVDIFVFNKEGVYLYNAADHALDLVAEGDHRSEIGMMPGGGGPRPAGREGESPAGARGPGPGARPSIDYPVKFLLVSENSRFGGGTAELKYEWGCLDAGMVAQNIMLFCSGNGLLSHPKAAIDKDKMKSLLKLTETQKVVLELPVGYPK